ncbi:unnamed protein product, partial [Ectocarpus sp. 13 AM-2016]
QVVDAFCTSRANLSGPKSVESVLAWVLRFCRLGGVEHLVAALEVVRRKVQAVNEAGGAAEASRLEAWTLSAALLSRVLHRLFQLNASYFESCPRGDRWSPATLFHASPPHLFMAAAAGAAAVPPGKEASGYQEKGGIPLPRLLDASAAATSSAKEPSPVAQEPDPPVRVTAVDLES